jgi:hypothetical protein
MAINRKRFYSLFIALGFAAMLHAQMAGNPVHAVGKREWTVGLSGNYLNQNLVNAKAVSRRFLAKSMWGVNDWLGLYGLIGTVQLSMNIDKKEVQNYKDRLRFAYGAGFHWQINLNAEAENSLGLWGDAQVMKFLSENSYYLPSQSMIGSMTDQFLLTYDWGEALVCGGLVLPVRNFRFYGGGAAWGLRRMDTKKQYRIDANSTSQYVGQSKGTYQSGYWTGGIIGIEWDLPQRYSISIEGLVFNKENYQIMVGISQTGSPEL